MGRAAAPARPGRWVRGLAPETLADRTGISIDIFLKLF